MTSCVLICTEDKRDEANAFLAALGWGDDNMSVPFSATGSEPVTHRAARAEVGVDFMTLMQDPATGSPFEVCDFRWNVESGGEHFREILSQLSLMRVEPTESKTDG